MHQWVKYYVNRCMKSDVIAQTSFVKDGWMDGQMDAQQFYVPPWLRHGEGQKDQIKMKTIGLVHDYIITANCSIHYQRSMSND